MLSPELLRRMGVRNPEQIASEMQQAMQQKTTMEQGVAGRGDPVQFPQSAMGGSPQPPMPGMPQGGAA